MPHLRLPHFRFTLRTFLIVCALPVPFLAWIANVKMTAVRQRAALARLYAHEIEWQEFAPLPTKVTTWMRRFVDQSAYTEVRRVEWTVYESNQVSFALSHEDIVSLTHLRGLRDLDLIPRKMPGGRRLNSRLTKSDLDFSPIARLRELGSFAVDAPIDDRAQWKIAAMPELHSLTVPSAQLTDRVLERLGSSEVLSSLEFDATRASPRGIAFLQNAPLLQTLSVWNLPTESNCLEKLLGCNALTHLTIYNSTLRLSDASTINRMPIHTLRLLNCQIERGFFAKLEHSKCLQSAYVRNRADDGRVLGPPLSLAELNYCDDHFTQEVIPPVEKLSEVAP